MNTEIPSEITITSTTPKCVCKVVHHIYTYTKLNQNAQKNYNAFMCELYHC